MYKKSTNQRYWVELRLQIVTHSVHTKKKILDKN